MTTSAVIESTLQSFMERVVESFDGASELATELYRAVTPHAKGHPIYEVSAALVLVAYRQLRATDHVQEIDVTALAKVAADIIRAGNRPGVADGADGVLAALTAVLGHFLAQAGIAAEADAVATPQGSA